MTQESLTQQPRGFSLYMLHLKSTLNTCCAKSATWERLYFVFPENTKWLRLTMKDGFNTSWGKANDEMHAFMDSVVCSDNLLWRKTLWSLQPPASGHSCLSYCCFVLFYHLMKAVFVVTTTKSNPRWCSLKCYMCTPRVQVIFHDRGLMAMQFTEWEAGGMQSVPIRHLCTQSPATWLCLSARWWPASSQICGNQVFLPGTGHVLDWNTWLKGKSESCRLLLIISTKRQHFSKWSCTGTAAWWVDFRHIQHFTPPPHFHTQTTMSMWNDEYTGDYLFSY